MRNSIIKTGSALFLFCAFASCSSKTYPDGTYQQTPVIIDGDLNEWSKPLRFGSNGGQMQYNVTNDKENIYISIETKDQATAMKILRSGVNIYIDPGAGKSKKNCIAFPLANNSLPAQSTGTSTSGARQGREDMMQSLLIQATTFNVTGFKNIDNRQYDVKDKSKIKIAIQPDMGYGLAYEAAIPIKYIVDDEKKGAQNISVGITINAMKGGGENYRSSGNSGGMGGGMRGGGRGGGRGMGGGGGGGYRRQNTDPAATQAPDRTALFKADVNWYAFKLAAK